MFFRKLLIPLLPFLLALGFSALLEPWVIRLCRKIRVKRAFAAAVLITAVLLVVGGGIALLLIQLGSQLRAWSAQLPELIETFPAVWNRALDQLSRWYSACPPFIRSALDHLAVQLTGNTPPLIGSIGGWLMDLASSLAGALPDVSLFIITTLLALYFTSISYPAILTFLKRQLPQTWQNRCRKAVLCCRTTMLKWLRSELTLIAVTFLLLLVGFTWMGLDFALLAATFIALVDALPVLGTGMILIPWALGALVIGQIDRALAVAALYAAVTIVHAMLEPRLLAGQVGLPPITTLLAIYLGFHLMGVGGMLLLPILLLLIKQLQDSEVIQLWK